MRKKMKRTEIIRALVARLMGSGLDVSGFGTEEDIAARPEVCCQCGQEERFMGWSGYLPCREKSNFLYIGTVLNIKYLRYSFIIC